MQLSELFIGVIAIGLSVLIGYIIYKISAYYKIGERFKRKENNNFVCPHCSRSEPFDLWLSTSVSFIYKPYFKCRFCQEKISLTKKHFCIVKGVDVVYFLMVTYIFSQLFVSFERFILSGGSSGIYFLALHFKSKAFNKTNSMVKYESKNS